MNKGARMLLMASRSNNSRGGRNNGRGRDYGRSEYDDGMRNNYDSDYGMDSRYRGGSERMNYDEGRMNYGPDSRFRDRRGREHYDNGRFAPMRNDGAGMWVYSRYWDDREEYRSPSSHYPMSPYVPPVYENDGRMEQERKGREYYNQSDYYKPMNKIGFSIDGEMGRPSEFGENYRSDAEYKRMQDEMKHSRSATQSGYAMRSGSSGPMTKEMACEWTSEMENEDGTRGPHWDIEQVKQVMGQYNINGNPWEFYAILNAIYSDYCKVFKKHGVGNDINFYIDMAKSWIKDSDAVKDKATAYYENVVKH